MNRLFKDGVIVTDYRNVVLVAGGLKPASEIGFRRFYSHVHDAPRQLSIKDESRAYAPQKKKRINDYLTLINKFSLSFDSRYVEGSHKCHIPGCNEIDFSEGADFSIAKDTFSLNVLLSAKSHTERGLIYGFPWDAIKFFDDPNRKGFSASAKMYYDIGQAINANIPIPSWIAYLSHVPEKTDFLNNDVSESSKVLGEKYQSFIRQNHPDLAKMIEEDFVMGLPSRTFVSYDGILVSQYDTKK